MMLHVFVLVVVYKGLPFALKFILSF